MYYPKCLQSYPMDPKISQRKLHSTQNTQDTQNQTNESLENPHWNASYRTIISSHDFFHSQDLMYKEPDRWAMPFQTYVTLTMLQTHTMATTKSVKLMERSLYSAKFCFVENMLNNGVLHPAMYDIIQEWYNYIDENICIQADLIGKLHKFC